MSTLKKATIKSSTFWINLFVAAGGVALLGFERTAQPIGDAVTATATTAAQSAAVTVTPETISAVANLFGVAPSADMLGIITIVLALANQALRYKTQRAHEKQLDGQ